MKSEAFLIDQGDMGRRNILDPELECGIEVQILSLLSLGFGVSCLNSLSQNFLIVK